MPEPPSARPVWLIDGVLALGDAPILADHTRCARGGADLSTFAEDEQGIWVHMDVEDTGVCVITEDRLAFIFGSPDGPANKADYSACTYRMHDVGNAVLVAKMGTPLPTFEHWINSTTQLSKLEQVEKALPRFPRADIVTYRKENP